jgi:hypothetical protein
MQIFEVVRNINYYYKILVLVKCTQVRIISSRASSRVVIPHVSSHISILHTSSMLLNCIISKQSFYQHGRAFGVFVPAALIGYL